MTRNDPTDERRALLQAFVADAQEAQAQGRSCRFWARQHHRLRPIEAAAPRILGPTGYEDYLVQRIRLTAEVPVGAADHPVALTQAWRRLLPLPEGRSALSCARLPFLFLMGFDDRGALPGEAPATAADLKARLACLAQIGSYAHLPGQRAGIARIAVHAALGPRALLALRRLGYRHDPTPRDDRYEVVNLVFWGLVLLALLHPDSRGPVLADLGRDDLPLPAPDRHRALLLRHAEAVAARAGPEEQAFHTRLAALRAWQDQRRAAGETAAFARELALPMPADQDWTIDIRIALRGDPAPPVIATDVLCLNIAADPDLSWTLTIQQAGETLHSEGPGYEQTHAGLPLLGRGHLIDLPAWLDRLRRDHALDFDPGAAFIAVARHRKAVRLLADWLARRPG